MVMDLGRFAVGLPPNIANTQHKAQGEEGQVNDSTVEPACALVIERCGGFGTYGTTLRKRGYYLQRSECDDGYKLFHHIKLGTNYDAEKSWGVFLVYVRQITSCLASCGACGGRHGRFGGL